MTYTFTKYFLDGFGTEEQLNELLHSDVLPLVRELQFKYGLKIMDKVLNVNYPEVDKDCYMMCYPNGVAVGKVWTTKKGGTNNDQLEFCFRSPYYRKARGQDANERETIRSTKLSSLMAVLKRQEIVKTMKHITDAKVKQVKQGVGVLRNSMGESSKPNSFTGDELHALLALALGESTDGILTPLDLNKCKNTLDIYKEADRIRDLKREESKRFFKNPFYLIGIDEFNHLLIGKFKITVIHSDTSKFEYEVIEDFKRHKTIEEYPELLPLMTMMKVSYEAKDGHSRKLGEYKFPIQDKYDEGLDAAFFYDGFPNHYEHAWMATPCST
jgi:hypothetical protein